MNIEKLLLFIQLLLKLTKYIYFFSFGRRPVMIICIILYIISGFLTPVSNGIVLYIFLKVLSAFLSMGFYLGGFVLCEYEEKLSLVEME